MQSKDLTLWNIVLMGYTIKGRMSEAMELFDEMLDYGFSPDGNTYIGRGGRIQEALEVVKNMPMKPNNPGLWEGVEMVRKMMEKHGIKKEAGCNWIQPDDRELVGVVLVFEEAQLSIYSQVQLIVA
ncbi:hypothetical protein U1Q18_003572, partial [Sarracenia purpurea var. burkii]